MSAVPGFLDALVPLCKQAADLQGWQVVDGLPLENSWGNRMLALGVSTEDLSVESSTGAAGLDSRRERADVTCLARSWTGDHALSLRRAQAFAAAAAVEAVLRADPTVGGSVSRAQVTSAIYSPAVGEKGTGAFVEFGIRIDAFRK